MNVNLVRNGNPPSACWGFFFWYWGMFAAIELRFIQNLYEMLNFCVLL